jgi:hypothetical protein
LGVEEGGRRERLEMSASVDASPGEIAEGNGVLSHDHGSGTLKSRPYKGVYVPAEIFEQLDDNGRKGWFTKGYRKTLDDTHLHLICKFLYQKYGAEGGKEWSVPLPAAQGGGMVEGTVAAADGASHSGQIGEMVTTRVVSYDFQVNNTRSFHEA